MALWIFAADVEVDMSKYQCWTPVGSSSGEIVAPRFNGENQLEEGVIFYVDTVGKQHSEITNDFVKIPTNWRDVWNEKNISTVPTGAFDYADSSEFELSGFPLQQEIHDAHTTRVDLVNKRIAMGSGGGGVVESDQFSNTLPMEPEESNLPEWQTALKPDGSHYESKAEWKATKK